MPFKNKKPYRREFEPTPRRAEGTDSEKTSAYPGTRIAKFIARAGLGSRRDVEAAIEQGRVTVNGKAISSPALNVTDRDNITLDGRPLPKAERTRVWLYNKPKGLVTTERDPEGRPTVFDNLPDDLPRVMSVGRLDINTEGLLILTNDGGLKRVLELPATGWLRRYRVRAFGDITQEQLDALKGGISIGGVDYGPIEAVLERDSGQNVWIVMGIREGKNREIKNIAEHLGLVVNRLIRISFGPFQLRDLEENEAREVSLRLLADQLGARLMREAGIDLGGGRNMLRSSTRIEKREPGSRFGKSATGKAERYADMQESGRRVARDEFSEQFKLEPKTLQDRKGRKVAVGKTMRTGYKKKFGADGQDEAPRKYTKGRFAKSASLERRSRDGGGNEAQGERPFRKKFDGDKKPFKKRFDRDGEGLRQSGDRPFKKPYDRSESGSRPFKKPYNRDGDSGGDKPFKKRYDREGSSTSKSAGDRPFKKRFDRPGSSESKPYRGDRPLRKDFIGGEKRPYAKRFDRKDGEGFKKTGDRPFKKRVDRDGSPPGRSSDKPFKKPYSRDGDRPFKKRFDDKSGGPQRARPAGKSEGFKGGKKPFGKKPFGKKPFGKKPFGKRPFKRDS